MDLPLKGCTLIRFFTRSMLRTTPPISDTFPFGSAGGSNSGSLPSVVVERAPGADLSKITVVGMASESGFWGAGVSTAGFGGAGVSPAVGLAAAWELAVAGLPEGFEVDAGWGC